MPFETILVLILGGLAGGFANGFAGTGTALFALGFLLTVLEPRQAVATIALVSVLAGLQGLWEVRRTILANRATLARFIIPGLLGVPVGGLLLGYVDAETLRLLVAALLFFYGAYFGFRAGLPRFERETPVLDGLIGLTGGVMGGMASISGAAPSIWLSLRPWPKALTRAALQSFNGAILATTVATLALGGAYTSETWTSFGIVLPPGVMAAWVGIRVFRRMTDDQYRRVLIILCLGLGLGVFLHALLT